MQHQEHIPSLRQSQIPPNLLSLAGNLDPKLDKLFIGTHFPTADYNMPNGMGKLGHDGKIEPWFLGLAHVS